MIFIGISRSFSLINEEQYDTIGAFWDEMAELYGLENLIGLGYNWRYGKMDYAIGLKAGEIPGANRRVSIPDGEWVTRRGRTEELKTLYDEIYLGGSEIPRESTEGYQESNPLRRFWYRFPRQQAKTNVRTPT